MNFCRDDVIIQIGNIYLYGSLYNSVIYLKTASKVNPLGSLFFFFYCQMPYSITDAGRSCSLAGNTLAPTKPRVMYLIRREVGE